VTGRSLSPDEDRGGGGPSDPRTDQVADVFADEMRVRLEEGMTARGKKGMSVRGEKPNSPPPKPSDASQSAKPKK
jgi:hypothetical protein